MRDLTYQEKRWAQSLSALKQKADEPIANWLNTSFFREQDGRALIIQAKEHYAVLFLSNTLFENSSAKQEEIHLFMELLSFLRYLHSEGYITITRGVASRETPMFFIQDGFVSPQPTKGPIVLNGRGEFTEKPDKIYDKDRNTVYQGIIFNQDHFDLIQSVCTGVLTVSKAIRDLLAEEDPPEEPVKKKAPLQINRMKLLLTGLVFLILGGLYAFIHYHATHQNDALARVSTHQASMETRLDSLARHFTDVLKEKKPDQSGAREETYYGIDVSKWNGDIVSVITTSDNLTFVICKATQGSRYTDPDFKTNWELIPSKGLIRGAYHFYDAGDDPIDQAEHFVKTIGSLDKKDIAPVLDIEPGSLPKNNPVDPTHLQVDLLLFLRHVQHLSKRRPVIYTDPSFANQYLINKKFANYPLWLADYTDAPQPTIPQTWNSKGYKFWQKSSSYDLNAQKVDFDEYRGKKSGIYLDHH